MTFVTRVTEIFDKRGRAIAEKIHLKVVEALKAACNAYGRECTVNDCSNHLLCIGGPGEGNDAAYGDNLVRANRGALAACQQEAARQGKVQGCNMIMRAQCPLH